ncbi:inorganic phosphate transporter [Baekduia soli]|uniref:Phosphate transporter n=1 Tax=Baekduia soli TaxID=496014 RepID=A0A5B8U9C7_9ACTN|nr:inorganic phosphate transporter [Baekduia soli]QEC49587.1 inorganic phosphate transporter [Baekduia soli]
MGSDLVLYIVVATALAFDFTNGFHDTANAIATSISTRALSPRAAVLMSAVLNFAGAFVSLSVAATVAKGIVEPGGITQTIVFGGLIGAIAWNLATWWFGLPSSSSHALIGGMVGSAFVAKGPSAILGDGILEKVVLPAVIAPILAFVVAGISILVAYRIVGRQRPGLVNRGYRLGQIVTGSLFSLAHGTNDAQKTMGIITLALIAHGDLSSASFHVPTWVVICSASAIALGTYSGGWRIIRTMGSRIIKMDPAQGFSAQGAGAAVVLTASHLGFPLSTTHVISGGVMGAGAAKRLSAVRWGLAGNIALAWVLTLPCAAVIGGAAYGLCSIFGSDAAGVIVVSLLVIGLLAAAFGSRVRRGPAITAEA